MRTSATVLGKAGAVLGAVLLAGLAGLWVRSLYRIDQLTRVPEEGNGWRVASVAGTLHFGTASRLMHGPGLRWQCSAVDGPLTDWAWMYPSPDELRRWAGFAVAAGSYDLGPAWVPYRVVVVPMWALMVPAAIPQVLWFAGVVRRRARRIAGRCVWCGYDLRASPERCPECGHRV